MKPKFIALSLLAGALSTSVVFADTTITGAGATFPYPVYAKWAEAFQKESKIQINYQPIGSGGGIQQIEAGTVDFGASDKPLSADELSKNGLIMFPTVLGAVVPVINLPNVKVNELKLTGPVLADIFLGKIKKWSDPALAQLNPGIKLPDQDIAVVHRSDGSGTSFLFTNYLSKVSEDWAKSVGSDTSVQWPVGVGGKGNEGVSLYVSQIPGSIGYVEYAYALSNHLAYPALQNKENAFVVPTKESVAAAASYADWNNPADPLTNEPGIKSWPITGATFILMHGAVKEADKEKALATLSFFDWAYHHGGDSASELNYVMLPSAVITNIQQNWKSQFKDEKGQPVWSK